MSTSSEPQKFADGDVSFWIEQDSSIHLKASSSHGDPVELSAEEARSIGLALAETARTLQASGLPHPTA